ncbi:hypothetical protein LAZ40_09790 [Cereibacter sphaeroides]|uniref:hypothetical protein n=1 Tax=Cereibacter sphaeroides TaxID=1063 RepID=UPI001F1F7435|nr:hypothetical protein [Cereibacter sphaeroides]MCE6959342.1 hypothetical protein [Cereibacter sphaeroides]MCE6972934.1 hypothetical protein [Cereibacter sphaeroides]
MIWTRNALAATGGVYTALTAGSWGAAKAALLLQKPLFVLGAAYAEGVALAWLGTGAVAAVTGGIALDLARGFAKKRAASPHAGEGSSP